MTGKKNPNVTIILQAINPKRLKPFLENVQATTSDLSNIEIWVAINHGNDELENYIIAQSEFLPVYYIKTNHTYYESQHNYNKLLFASNQNSTYVHCVSDRFRYITPNWDTLLDRTIQPGEMGIYQITDGVREYTGVTNAWFRCSTWSIYARKFLNALGGFYEYYYCHDCCLDMILYFIQLQEKSRTKKGPLTHVVNIPIKWETEHSSHHGISIQNSFWFRHLYSNYYIMKTMFTLKGLQKMSDVATRFTNISYKIPLTFAIIERIKKRKCGYGAEFVNTFNFLLRFNFIYCLVTSENKYIKQFVNIFTSLCFIEEPYREMLRNHEFKKIFLEGSWRKITTVRRVALYCDAKR